MTQYATAVRGLRAELIADVRRVNPELRDAMVFCSAEIRVPVARVLEDWVPTATGVLSLADAGRVWADGDSSSRVHAVGGGGV
ncbi:MAG TPA: hypothetical protein VH764_06035 [Gemmatimonadales bacterium]